MSASARLLTFPERCRLVTRVTKRARMSGALRDMAETNFLRAEPLPVPNAGRSDAQAELEEPIFLVLQTALHISLQMATPRP